MKRLTVLSVIILIVKIAFAQTTIVVNGTVTDDKGNPVSFAFIKDAQHNYQTFSGPDGTFKLNADPFSRLMATEKGFKRAIVPVNNNTNITIQMVADGNAGTPKAKSAVFEIQEIGGADRDTRPMTNFGTQQEQLHGSPFLFENWVHGYAVSPSDSIIQNSNYLFNYQKIDGTLLYTDDGKTVYAVYKSKVKAFTLFDDAGLSYSFEDISVIDPKHYVQVIASGNKYNMYKNLGTKFLKADFQTNGISSSGNNYDSYSDESTYYLVKVPGGQPQKFNLKRKAIKVVFDSDGAKVDRFFSDNDTDDIDDAYLKKLCDYMNN
jgi:hypothetical protein